MVDMELEDYCSKEMEYILDFTVYKLKMTEEGEEEPEPEDLLILMSFDNNIFKFPIPAEDFKTFKVKKSFFLFCTPLDMFEKLKSTPIMFSVSKGMTELGEYRFSLSSWPISNDNLKKSRHDPVRYPRVLCCFRSMRYLPIPARHQRADHRE